MLTRRARDLLATAAMITTAGCGGTVPPRVDATVYSWLQCQDCMHQQRARVVALGDTAVPRLAMILIQGPPPPHDSAYVASLRRLAQQSQGLTPALIEHQRQMFGAVYRRRALLALQDIGSAAARSSLCLSRASTPPASPWILVLDSSLTTLGATCP
jgi:hypothetical protein